jgi:hypothetical protein
MEMRIGREVVIEALRLRLVRVGELQIDGTLNSPTAQTQLGRHLNELHAHILREKLTSFTVDLRALKLVNSSAIRLFVDWISRAEIEKYKLVFMTDRTITWHRLSFSVLKSLAPSSVEIV